MKRTQNQITFFLLVLVSLASSCKKETPSPNSNLAKELVTLDRGLKVGVSNLSILPESNEGVSLSGYSPRPASGINDTISARCIIIADDSIVCAFISLDVIGVMTSFSKKIKLKINASTGIPLEHIFIHATHTHSAPSLEDQSYWDFVINQASYSAVLALQNAEPADASIISGISEVETFNRRNPELEVHNAYYLISFTDRNDSNIAHLVNYSCHPVVLGPENEMITADYVHYLRQSIEEQAGGISVFFNGYAGNINPPGMVNDDNVYGRMGSFSDAREFGEAVAHEMLEDLSKQEALSIKLNCKTIGAYLGDRHSYISLIDMGDVQIATIPGETCDGVGHLIEDNMTAKYPLIFSITNDGVGYIIAQDNWEACSNSFLPYCYEETKSPGESTASDLLNALQKLIEQ